MKKRNKVFLLILLSLVTLIRTLLYLTPSPLMEQIIADLNISLEQGGFLLVIVMLFQGIAVIIGSLVIDKIGSVKTMIIACFFCIFEGIIGYLSNDYIIILIGRALTGIGFGLSSIASTVLIMQSFNEKERSFANTYVITAGNISLSIAFMITVPLYKILGNWEYIGLLWSACSFIVLVLFYIWPRKKIQSVHYRDDSYKKNSLLIAIKNKEIVSIGIATVATFLVYACFISYLPTYFHQIKGFDIQSACVTTSIISTSGFLGCLLCGILASFKKILKRLMLFLVVVAYIGAIGMMLVSNSVVLYIMIFSYGFAYSGWAPVIIAYIMNMKDIKPSIVGAAVAIITGSGCFISVIIPSVFNALVVNYNMKLAFLIISFLLIVPIIISISFYKRDRKKYRN